MHYDVVAFAANDHTELEVKMSTWFRKHRPSKIIATNFVADGTEYTYCYVMIYEPRELPLPKTRKKD